jgi:hypothetical protein
MVERAGAHPLEDPRRVRRDVAGAVLTVRVAGPAR